MGSSEVLARTLLENRFLSASAFRENLYTPTADAPQGKPYGKYLVLRKIGEGGLSKVFLALDPLLQRRVAIKVLKRPDPEDLARFRREAQIAAELNHPNIVPLYETGQVGKETYIAMGYIEGSPPRAMEPEAAARIILKVARGLAVAHDRGLVHRDVKPQNIILDREGEPFLTDFGMAKHYHEEGFKFLSQTGTVVGTPCYMSPEQARGETRTLAPATDVYSLGATLYYLSTGCLPFDGATPLEVIRRVVETRPPNPRSLNPLISRPLAAVVRKAMAPEAADRYPDARAMADDLERCLNRRPVFAARVRIPWPVAACAVIAIALLLAVALSPSPDPPAPAAAPKEAKVPPAPAPVDPPAEPKPKPVEPTAEAKPPPAPPPPEVKPPAKPAGAPIEAALKVRVRRQVLEQPLAYQDMFLSEPERRRAWKLLSADRGTVDDLRFLRNRLGAEVAGLIEAEKRFLAGAIAGREARVRRVDAPDVLRFKTQRILLGRVLEESDARVHFEFRKQAARYPRHMIDSVKRGASPEAQFVKRLDALGKNADPAAWVRLAEWCRENKLDPHREYVLYRILQLEPVNGAARRDLGLPGTGPLRRSAPEAAVASGPDRPVEFEGKTVALKDLQKTLQDRGFVVIGNRWCRLREWTWESGDGKTITVPPLTLHVWNDVVERKGFDSEKLEIVTLRRPVEKFRYFCPVLPEAPPGFRITGAARITIEAPGPIYDGTVRAFSAVSGKGGSITVSVETKDREAARLFALTEGEDRKEHDLGPLVRGARRFTLVAQIEAATQTDGAGAPQATAFFLKRGPKDPPPLRVRLRLAEPVPSLKSIPPPR